MAVTIVLWPILWVLAAIVAWKVLKSENGPDPFVFWSLGLGFLVFLVQILIVPILPAGLLFEHSAMLESSAINISALISVSAVAGLLAFQILANRRAIFETIFSMLGFTMSHAK
ncbi:unnamed protein product [Caenorhabditis auriculariae]|uniref:Uncharacterized protein n=1 Tax=Caenorhabditis auriculariae TaxID=2777116 RepID=A0A8S1HDR3_9PELO|nr:unnamed protein product [Caenorhabditis auriculariae]